MDTYLQELRAYNNFSGRTGKIYFWNFVLLNFVFGLVISSLSHVLFLVFVLITFLPSLAIGVRRLHDVGKTGLNLLWGFIPIIGWLYLILLFTKEGDYYVNKWGSSPQELCRY